MGGLIGVAGHVLTSGHAGEHQNGFHTGFDSGDDVGIHAVADHNCILGVDVQVVKGGTHHEGVGFANEEGAVAAGLFDEGSHGTTGGHNAFLGGAGRIGVGGDEVGTGGDQADGFGDELQVVGVGFAQHYVVGIVIGDDVTDTVDGLGQATFADDKGGAARLLGAQEMGSGHGRGEDALSGDVQPGILQAVGQVTGCVERIVGEHQVFGTTLLDPLDEAVGAGDDGTPADEDAIHVGYVILGWLHGSFHRPFYLRAPCRLTQGYIRFAVCEKSGAVAWSWPDIWDLPMRLAGWPPWAAVLI